MTTATHTGDLSQGQREPGRFFQWQITVLVSMYGGYAAFMLCRNTLIASSAALMADPTLGLDKASYGQLMSWHTAGAILGKLVTGPCADLLGGRRLFLLALSLTALANIGFAFGSSFFAFAAFNFMGQFAKAGGWPAMTKFVGQWYPPQRYGQVWSIISTSSRVGTIAAGLLLGYALSLVSWRAVFLISAAVTLGVVFLLWFFLKEKPADVGLTSLADHQHDLAEDGTRDPNHLQAQRHAFDDLSWYQVCGKFLGSGRFWFICLSIVFLTVMMDFLTFIPIYLSESLGVSPSQASMAGMAFPTGMFAALVATSFVYDRLTKAQLIACLGGLLTVSCLCVALLWRFDVIPYQARTVVAIATLFLLGFSVSPAYYVPGSVFAVSYGGKHSGFLIALVDICGYSASFVFTYFGGSVAQHYGWTVFLAGLLTVAGLATACTVTFLTLDWKAHKRAEKHDALGAESS